MEHRSTNRSLMSAKLLSPSRAHIRLLVLYISNTNVVTVSKVKNAHTKTISIQYSFQLAS